MKIIWRLVDSIGGNLIRRLLHDQRRGKLPPAILAKELKEEEELRRQKLIQQINYYNYLSIFYFLRLNRWKVLITSTVLLDYLLFLIPLDNYLEVLREKMNWLFVFEMTAYFLVLTMVWEVLSKFPQKKKTSLVSSKGLLLIILVLLIFGSIFQIILSEEIEASPIRTFRHLIFLLIACTPIIISIFNTSNNRDRPDLSNLLIIFNYTLPIILLRLAHLIATISIVILAERYWEYTVFSLILLLVLIQKRPLVERLSAPLKPQHQVRSNSTHLKKP